MQPPVVGVMEIMDFLLPRDVIKKKPAAEEASECTQGAQ
jgi:hypothetical protein